MDNYFLQTFKNGYERQNKICIKHFKIGNKIPI